MGFEVRSKTGAEVPGLGAWVATTGNQEWMAMAAEFETNKAADANYPGPLGNLAYDEMVNAFVAANNLEIIEI
jgi:hypothetical protein